MTNEEFRKVYFDRFSGENCVFGDEWFEDHFEEYKDSMDLEESGESNNDNYASGDESWQVWSISEGDFSAFWTTNSWGAIEGPFKRMDEAATALGFDPKNFPPEPEADEED